MKVNFKTFKRTSDVESFLQKHLPLGQATATDVLMFLDNLRLKHSDLIADNHLPNTITYSEFEEMILARVRARPTLFILVNEYFIHFMFTNKILIRIVVVEYSIGF